MQLFFWRKNKLIDEFAFQLADELFSTIHPTVALNYFDAQSGDSKNSNKKKDEQVHQKIIRALNNVIIKIQQFRELNKLGIYGKARLHLTFTERLKDLGYEAAVAEQINKLILLQTP